MDAPAAFEALYVLNVCTYQVAGALSSVRGCCYGPAMLFGHKCLYVVAVELLGQKDGPRQSIESWWRGLRGALRANRALPLSRMALQCRFLGATMPPTLLLQAMDDPWVPASAAMDLAQALPPAASIRTLFTSRGGHNGFHGRGGCWGDQLAVAWLRSVAVG